MPRCAGCPANVIWLHNDKTGKSAPVDVTPVPDGNVTVDHEAQTYHVMTKAEKLEADGDSLFDDGRKPSRYTLHFATCPRSAHFRRCTKCHHSPCTCKD